MRSNRSIPDCQVIPELAYPDVSAASAWLCKAFGFSERLRIANHRIQLSFGAGAFILTTASGPASAAASSTHSVMVRVDDVDGHFTRSQQAGARVLGSPTTWPYGERHYAAEDPAGHRWIFTQSVDDVHPRDWGGVLVEEEKTV